MHTRPTSTRRAARTLRYASVMRSLALTLVCASQVGCPAARRNPKLSRSYYLLGRDYFAKKQPSLAKSELLKAIKHNPDNGEAHQLLGVIFFLEGVHASNFIDRRQCIKGDAAKDQLAEANAAFRLAAKHLDRVVKLSKKTKKAESDALNYLANIALHFERYDKAIKLCDQALDNILYRDRYLALGARGQAYFKQGDLKSAARDLRQSLFHKPTFCLGRYWLAKVYYARKQYDAAAAELLKVTADKRCPLQEAYQLLGLCYLKQRKSEEARALFQQCVTRNPKSCISQECKRYAQLI
ncbi:MAG: hypothetical protein CSA24_01800 [Deltaproteobacteria bacterium]|nr:MAG: hypothetical protein CSB49_07470 [Pseudomonadota bacterium]PIE65857.1 MAG: hypothetical protein CSA24_01800 [Deltaproteobacteria bacterium]